MSAAATYIRDMWADECTGWGDKAEALRRICRRHAGLRGAFWTLKRIAEGRTERVDAGMAETLRLAFAAHCKRKAQKLLAAAAQAERDGRHGLDDADLVEVAAVLARLESEMARTKTAPAATAARR